MNTNKQLPLFHLVTPYTRLAYLVQSATRADVAHLVDLEGFDRQPVVCTCEDFIYNGNRHCGHIRSVAIQV